MGKNSLHKKNTPHSTKTILRLSPDQPLYHLLLGQRPPQDHFPEHPTDHFAHRFVHFHRFIFLSYCAPWFWPTVGGGGHTNADTCWEDQKWPRLCWHQTPMIFNFFLPMKKEFFLVNFMAKIINANIKNTERITIHYE